LLFGLELVRERLGQQRSQRFDTKTLVANARRSKSQQHLLAISQLRSLEPEVTDVLVTRGDQEVVRSGGQCRRAAFQLWHLADHQPLREATRSWGRRKDIPRHLFHQLIAKASENAKKPLGSERPEAAGQIAALVTDVTGALHSKFGPASKSYFNAKKAVAGQHAMGDLGEKLIFEYAQSHKFEETTVGLALLSSLPVDVVERALNNKNKELALIVTKALGFSWQTAMSLLFLGAPDHRISAQDLEKMKREFGGLNRETSRSILQTYQSRKQAMAAEAGNRRLPQLHNI
jgi:uncharacterized protein (DUF2336 family)